MTQFTAFEGHTCVARGDLRAMVTAQRAAAQNGVNLLIYDDATGDVRDVDLRAFPPPARGRPKLGVKAREVTLLPGHWTWLSTQKGGASAALRRVRDEAIAESGGQRSEAARQTAVYAFLGSIAGDLPHFEEACRVLFAGNWTGFAAQIENWPEDMRVYALKLADLSD